MESTKGLRSLSTVDMARFNEEQIVGSHELSGNFSSLPLLEEKREGEGEGESVCNNRFKCKTELHLNYSPVKSCSFYKVAHECASKDC